MLRNALFKIWLLHKISASRVAESQPLSKTDIGLY